MKGLLHRARRVAKKAVVAKKKIQNHSLVLAGTVR